MEVETRALLGLKKMGHFERENERPDKYTLGDELPAKLSALSLHRPVLKPTMSAKSHDFTIRRLTEKDKDNVLNFLRKFFFRDEPMNVAVKLLETSQSRCLPLEEYALSSLEDAVSLVAVDHRGDVVGVVINGVSRKQDPVDVSAKAEECPDAKFRRVLKVLAHLDTHAQVWRHAPANCDTVMEVRIASTHADWRGRGLMRRLCEETESLAREIGAGAIRMDTTSAFSAAAAERLCYRRVYHVRYAEIPDAPQPSAPHTHVSVYLKDL